MLCLVAMISGIVFASAALPGTCSVGSDVSRSSQSADKANVVLPLPVSPTASIAGRTLADSKHQWRQPPEQLSPDAPNIVIFMSDDAGFSNPEIFGGPVNMPTMTRLAQTGVAFNHFHTTAMCSPTRAALLTGRNHHHVGSGVITELASDFDGYVGEIPKSTATVARVLSGYGYATAAFGKWHNTPTTHLSPMGPFDLYPTGLGFGYFYGFLAGESSQYEPRLYENTVPIEPSATPEEGYHFTEDITNQAIKFIRNNRALMPDRPFFIYFAPGAVHGPHHVSKAWADKYKGKFDEGWEKLRETTFARQKAKGWIPKNAELTPIDPTMVKWSDIPTEHRAFHTRLMEVYAGFMEHTDVNYGRIVDEIERQGLRNNTLIIYVHSDNGASADGMNGTISEMLGHNGMLSTTDKQLAVLNRDYGGLPAIGGPLLDNMYHHGWAWAGGTPFKSTKMVAAHFGGTRTPCVVSWPRMIRPDATPRPQFHHVIDIVPTIYEAVRLPPPVKVDGTEQDPLDGVSMMYAFSDASAPEQKAAQYFELMGGRGVYQKGWFACTFGPRTPWRPDPARVRAWDPDDDAWELYNIAEDFSQAHDLAASHPRKLSQMKDLFTLEAAKNNVFPLGAGLYVYFYHPEEARRSPLTEWEFFDGQRRIAEPIAPKFTSGFSTLATIYAEVPKQAHGVLFCLGGINGGFTVYFDEGILYAEYNALGLDRYEATSAQPLASGSSKIEVETKFDGPLPSGPATLTLRVNGESVGSGRVEKSVRMLFSASETFDVGLDLGSPVALRYHKRAPFRFSGTIHSLRIKYI